MKEKRHRLFNIKELSDWIGIVWQLYNLVHQHKIPVVRIDGKLRFDPESIEKWIKANEENPIQDP